MLRRLGYVPRGVVWTGEALPREVFLQWRKWCLDAAPFGPELDEDLRDSQYAGGARTAPRLGLQRRPYRDACGGGGTVSLLPARADRAALDAARRARACAASAIAGFFSERHRDSRGAARSTGSTRAACEDAQPPRHR